jgi:hypothetical protein
MGIFFESEVIPRRGVYSVFRERAALAKRLSFFGGGFRGTVGPRATIVLV